MSESKKSKGQEDFYIGWQDEMPPATGSFLKKRLLPLLLLMLLLAFVLVYTQRPYNDHSFELGKQTAISGLYYHTPFPMLIADEGILPEGLSREILLVSYGKFGARGTMESIMETAGDLNGSKIRLNGTLIFGDGKTLMELTKQEAAYEGKVGKETASPYIPSHSLEKVSLHGEILDPKCYFGVMKPGEGKIHKSCAIRCISGGIPPVFRTAAADGGYDYFLIKGEDGSEINQALLPFVGETIELSGRAFKSHGWDVLYCKPPE